MKQFCIVILSAFFFFVYLLFIKNLSKSRKSSRGTFGLLYEIFHNKYYLNIYHYFIYEELYKEILFEIILEIFQEK